MKLLKLVPLFLIPLAVLSACKKEDENVQTIVQKQIIGKWYLKFNIKTIYTNEIVTKFDTLIKYNPIDTLTFTMDGLMIRRNKTPLDTTTYSIAADGESINFGTKPATTKKITFISPSRLGFADETTSGNTRTLTEDHLLRY